MSESENGYNQRLFSGGNLRSYLHNARFRWLSRKISKQKLSAQRVLEVGCFDAKLLQWLPAFPTTYFGIDANWEGGLDIALNLYRDDSRVHLINSSDPLSLSGIPDDFDLGVSMETLEHVPDKALGDYLELFARQVDGQVIFTVPVEIGPVFAIKWMVKRWVLGSAEQYSASEFLCALIGKSSGVARNEHKGFDYRNFVREVEAHFEVVEVESIHSPFIPLWLSFGIGVTASTPVSK